MASIALGDPGEYSCWDLSGSLSQSSVYLGTVLRQSDLVSARVVQLSCPVLGWVILVGNALSSLTLVSASPADRGRVLPSKSVTDSFSAAVCLRRDRSCSSTTGLEPAIMVGMPASWSISARVGVRRYFPSVSRSPR